MSNIRSLIIGGPGNIANQSRNLFDFVEDFNQAFSSFVSNFGANGHLIDGAFDKTSRFFGGFSTTGSQGSYFFSDHSKTFAMLSGSGRFNSGVQG